MTDATGAAGAAAVFAGLCGTLGGEPGVTLPPAAGASRGFGSDALKVDGRIFAMVTGGALVLKLPRGRVAALLASGEGRPFDAGKGTPMREWVVLADPDEPSATALAREAMTFVRG